MTLDGNGSAEHAVRASIKDTLFYDAIDSEFRNAAKAVVEYDMQNLVAGADVNVGVSSSVISGGDNAGTRVLAGGTGRIEFDISQSKYLRNGKGYEIVGYAGANPEFIFNAGDTEFSENINAGLEVDDPNGDLIPLIDTFRLETGTNFQGNGLGIGISGDIFFNSLHNALVQNNDGPGVKIGSDGGLLITDASTVSDNGGAGVEVLDGGKLKLSDATIDSNDSAGIEVNTGGTAILESGNITNNLGDGLRVHPGGTADIESPTFSGNGGIPVDIGNDGPTANDPDDADTGQQNFPNITNATVSGNGDVTVDYSVDSAPQYSTYPLNIAFYKLGVNGDYLFLGSDEYDESEAETSVSTTFTSEVSVSTGDEVVSRAVTDADWPSEFSPSTTVS